jgi:hypothetical protein
MVGIIIDSDKTFLKIPVVGGAAVSVNSWDTLGVTMGPNSLQNMHDLKHEIRNNIDRRDTCYRSSDSSDREQRDATIKELLPAERELRRLVIYLKAAFSNRRVCEVAWFTLIQNIRLVWNER